MAQDSAHPLTIVGAGHGAAELATSLREQGWQGSITLIGDEPLLPYQRPPLSKACLNGSMEEAALLIKSPASYLRSRVETILGVRVVSLNCAAKQLTLSDGRTLPYGKLALATGGRPRTLPGEEGRRAARAPNFFYLRSLDDARRLRAHLVPGARIAIVGAGYIGLEVAATARENGMHVTVLEAMPRVLARVTSPELSAFVEDCHRKAGVEIRTGTKLQAFDYAPDGNGERI